MTENKEQQELAELLAKHWDECPIDCSHDGTCAECDAEFILDAGYRKSVVPVDQKEHEAILAEAKKQVAEEINSKVFEILNTEQSFRAMQVSTNGAQEQTASYNEIVKIRSALVFGLAELKAKYGIGGK